MAIHRSCCSSTTDMMRPSFFVPWPSFGHPVIMLPSSFSHAMCINLPCCGYPSAMLRPFISHAVAQQLIVLVMMNITLVLYNLLITAFSYLVYHSIMPRQGNRSTQGQRPIRFHCEIGDAEPNISCSKKQKTSPSSTDTFNGSAMSMDAGHRAGGW